MTHQLEVRVVFSGGGQLFRTPDERSDTAMVKLALSCGGSSDVPFPETDASARSRA